MTGYHACSSSVAPADPGQLPLHGLVAAWVPICRARSLRAVLMFVEHALGVSEEFCQDLYVRPVKTSIGPPRTVPTPPRPGPGAPGCRRAWSRSLTSSPA